jgi:hypothetical protein
MSVKRPVRSGAQELERIRQRNQRRADFANTVTILMLILTLAVLGWVAYQINHPIVINLSGLR